ncbi:MAG: sigma-70 family RNA polymerase sigma factor [Chitinophagaceae bacterium]|nr:sigma-70 family RNA polymerase sigma factor [Chitinophagaceae bacterium]
MNPHSQIAQLYKTEYRKIISVLCKLFGLAHIEIAEDIANDTFLLATENWHLKGIPDNPAAWLYTVAKNKTRDYIRRHKLFFGKIKPEIQYGQSVSDETVIDLSPQNMTDSQLQMIFALCNPLISPEGQIGLALKILCGFSTAEIAEAFLTSQETIQKRLFRAKEKLRTAAIKIEFPDAKAIEKRLETVLTTLYLLFNEGYHTRSKQTHIRKELCLEAMRLCYLLIENKNTNKPAVNALMALMCFHASRLNARMNQQGEAILYEAQNRALWDEDLIARGNYFLIQSAQGNDISKYHLEASIAYWHCTKFEPPDKWEKILQLYNQLLQIEYSPVTALNRTFALSKVRGKEKAIEEALKLDLQDNHFYHTLLGNLYSDIDDKKALGHFQEAGKLAKSPSDQNIIHQHIDRLQNSSHY